MKKVLKEESHVLVCFLPSQSVAHFRRKFQRHCPFSYSGYLMLLYSSATNWEEETILGSRRPDA